MPQTLFDKIWQNHLVHQEQEKPALLYIDLHLIHEITSPQAFAGLRANNRPLRRPDLTLATVDHGIPTRNRHLPIADNVVQKQVELLRANCSEHGIKLFDIDSSEQGIVHVYAPELGLSRPGMTIVCGDSHTATHGASGALAFGIGTSEVEHVFATQCLSLKKQKNMLIRVSDALPFGVTAKDLILGIIGRIGTGGATGHVVEYVGETIKNLSMEERMTVCNMSIEAGARAGLIAPDETTFTYLKGRRYAPQGENWERAVEHWRALPSDPNSHFDAIVEIDAASLSPCVTWGTSPSMSAPVTETVPDIASDADENERKAHVRALEYMGLQPGQKLTEIPLDRVFIGSCTNGRIEDLRAAAKAVKGYRVAPQIKALVVPGSQTVKRQAEAEGIAQVFIDAGFEWRDSGCSMCLGMNDDVLLPRQRCAATSNRNFEGRQGRDGRTHLCSPPMAAAAAVAGHFVDIRDWKFKE